jgi:hypothetical protein
MKVKRRKGRRSAIIEKPYPAVYGTANLGHVVLLGDSTIDNENYTYGAPDVTQRLHGMLGDDWKVSLLARDGATTRSLGYQLPHIPADASHLVVSIGGNDANGEAGILVDPELRTFRETLEELAFMTELFAMRYSEAMIPLLELGIPVTVCTIYDCDFPEEIRDAVRAALAMFNDVIIRFAMKNSLDLLDLRDVCTSPQDYEMVIEPSGTGGAKIAMAITRRMVAHASAHR